MTSLPHPLPSRTTQNIAALFGHEDDTLVAWQRFCVQAAEALRAQHDPERLTKALRLAQDGAVTLADDGSATVASGDERYPVTAAGTCGSPATRFPRRAACRALAPRRQPGGSGVQGEDQLPHLSGPRPPPARPAAKDRPNLLVSLPSQPITLTVLPATT